jgi:hypothetical protein
LADEHLFLLTEKTLEGQETNKRSYGLGMETESEVYDLKDLKKEIKLGTAALRTLIKCGRLEGRKIGGGYYVTGASLLPTKVFEH